jgi:hypothetical protein
MTKLIVAVSDFGKESASNESAVWTLHPTHGVHVSYNLNLPHISLKYGRYHSLFPGGGHRGVLLQVKTEIPTLWRSAAVLGDVKKKRPKPFIITTVWKTPRQQALPYQQSQLNAKFFSLSTTITLTLLKLEMFIKQVKNRLTYLIFVLSIPCNMVWFLLLKLTIYT